MKTQEQERKEFEETSDKFANSAFPTELNFSYQSKHGLQFKSNSKGLSKREYFASNLMAGMIGQKYGHVDGKGDAEECARLSVEYADALIAELNKESI